MQYEGGPCAVIAPVQGFIVKNAVFGDNVKEDLSTVTGGWVFNLLTPGKFYKSFFFKFFQDVGIKSGCQTVWLWVQTVCKVYQ